MCNDERDCRTVIADMLNEYVGYGGAARPLARGETESPGEHVMTDILYEQRGAVAWITINRPEARNTLSPAAFVALADTWQEVRDNAATSASRC